MLTWRFAVARLAERCTLILAQLTKAIRQAVRSANAVLTVVLARRAHEREALGAIEVRAAFRQRWERDEAAVGRPIQDDLARNVESCVVAVVPAVAERPLIGAGAVPGALPLERD